LADGAIVNEKPPHQDVLLTSAKKRERSVCVCPFSSLYYYYFFIFSIHTQTRKAKLINFLFLQFLNEALNKIKILILKIIFDKLNIKLDRANN